MAITTLDGYIGSAKQRVALVKTASRTAIAALPFSVFDLAGNPIAGTLAGTSTTEGVVPTDLTTGFPVIDAFGGGATGYISGIEHGSSVACRLRLYDMLFKAGAYAFNANVTLSAQPSYSSRVPGGTNFGGTELWLEAVSAFTGALSIAVTYTNQAGTAGRTTGTVVTGVTPTLGRMVQIPLAAGDTGLQKIESVVATISSAGTFNLLVLKHLWTGRVGAANSGDSHDMLRTGLPVVYADSALFLQVLADSTATGLPDLYIEVASG